MINQSVGFFCITESRTALWHPPDLDIPETKREKSWKPVSYSSFLHILLLPNCIYSTFINYEMTSLVGLRFPFVSSVEFVDGSDGLRKADTRTVVGGQRFWEFLLGSCVSGLGGKHLGFLALGIYKEGSFFSPESF